MNFLNSFVCWPYSPFHIIRWLIHRFIQGSVADVEHINRSNSKIITLKNQLFFRKTSALGTIHSCVDQTLNAPFCIVVVLINEGYAY